MHLKDTTLLILNYERPGNLIKICERFQDFCFIEIINNNPTYSIPKNFYGAKIINNKTNMYCIERWYRAIKCKTPYVCLLDDDILPYRKTIFDLRKNLIINPTSLIGINHNNPLGIVDIVFGACTIVNISSLKRIFQKYIIPMNRPKDGDDIIVSLGLTKKFNNKHYIINGEIEILAGNKIKVKSYERCLIFKKFERMFNN